MTATCFVYLLSRLLEPSPQGLVFLWSFFSLACLSLPSLWASRGDWSWPVGGMVWPGLLGRLLGWDRAVGFSLLFGAVAFSLLYGSTRKGTGLSTPVAVFLGRWSWLTGTGKCLWGSLWPLVLWAFVFSGDYGHRPHYVRVEYMTGRERRDGPPLMVYFVYVVICIVFVVLWTHWWSVCNWVHVVPCKCILLVFVIQTVYSWGWLLHSVRVFIWAIVVQMKCG
jgi:hypothetical protein